MSLTQITSSRGLAVNNFDETSVSPVRLKSSTFNAEAASTARCVVSLIGGCAVMLASGSVYGWGVISAYLTTSFGYSNEDASTMGTMQVMGIYVTFHWGIFFDKYGARPSLALGGSLMTLGWLLTYWGVTNRQPAILVGLYQIIAGQSVQPLMVSAMDNVRNFKLERRGLCSGLVFTGFALTSILMAQAKKHIFPDNLLGMVLSLTVGGIVCVIFQIVVFVSPPVVKSSVPELPDFSAGARRRHFKMLLCHRELHLFWLCLLFFSMTLYLWIVNIGALNSAAGSPGVVSDLITEFGLCNLFSRPIVGLLSDVVPLTRAQITAVGSVAVAAAAMAVGLEAIVPSAFMIGIADGWMFAVWPALAREIHGSEHFGITFSLYLFCFGVGDYTMNLLLGKTVLPPTTEVGGVLLAGVICCALNLLGACLVYMVHCRLKSQQEMPEDP